MKQKDIITYILIGGGVYALYWYLNNYGKEGRIAVSGGKGSYWDEWFGAMAAVAPAPAAGTPAQTPAPAPPALAAKPPAQPSTNLPPPVHSFRQALLTASNNVNSLNIDQWSFYAAQVGGKPLSPDTVATMLSSVSSRDQTMDVDAYVGLLIGALSGSVGSNFPGFSGVNGKGVGDITPARTLMQTQGARPGMRNPWGRLPVGGGYVN